MLSIAYYREITHQPCNFLRAAGFGHDLVEFWLPLAACQLAVLKSLLLEDYHHKKMPKDLLVVKFTHQEMLIEQTMRILWIILLLC